MTDCTFDWQKVLPKDVTAGGAAALAPGGPMTPEALASMLLSRDALRHPSVRRYVGFLKNMHELFIAIAELYDRLSPPNSRWTKESLRQINVPEMMYMANALYILDSFGVGGGVLECGCYQGFSTCCLSHVCRYLNRPLWSADSFQGLPWDSVEEGDFRKGDFAVAYEQVVENVRAFGCMDRVRFIKGWFADSLRDWKDPLALLWIDADLYESTRDVMAHVFPSLDRAGAVFMHEFTDGAGVPFARGTRTVPGAVYEALDAAGVACRTHVMEKYFGVMFFNSTPQPCAPDVLRALLPLLAQMDPRARAFRELRDSRTVKAAFRLKRWLFPFRSDA